MSVYRLARRDDDDILAVYLQGFERFEERQADRYHDDLHALFLKLADHPAMARLRSELTPPVRVFAFKAHVVIYEDVPDGVVILSVRHSHEDWQEDPLGSQERRALSDDPRDEARRNGVSHHSTAALEARHADRE